MVSAVNHRVSVVIVPTVIQSLVNASVLLAGPDLPVNTVCYVTLHYQRKRFIYVTCFIIINQLIL